jgi:hypothetical protein
MTISTPHGPEVVLGRNYPTMHGPVVNINGSARSVLLHDHIDVMRAARILLDALRAATPHGRDYQTVDEAIASSTYDRMVHEGMKADVANIMDQYERIAERLSLLEDSGRSPL